MKYRLVKKVVTDRHNVDYVTYYTERCVYDWEKVNGSETRSLQASKNYYRDLINPPTVTTEVLATDEVK